MDKLTVEQMAKGRERFLHGHSEIKRRLEALTQAEANALGISLEQLRESETMRELREVAHAKGIDSVEFFWSYVADTAEEFGAMLARRDVALKRDLGL